MHAHWRAANCLSVGQIYLRDNPLLEEPLQFQHVKTRLLGHWGTTPGINLLYVHLNRLIVARDGAVLPILHLNGYKIANPTVLARIDRDELTALMQGYGHEPHFVEGNDPAAPCTRAWQRRSTPCTTASGRSSRPPARPPPAPGPSDHAGR